MSDELVLYTNPMSRGRIAQWMLEEVGAPYRIETLDYGTTMKAPDYLAINPMGKVPAIVHNGAVVTEGAAICAYLAAAFPAAGLMPEPGTPASATYHRWLFFAAGPLEAAITDRALGVQIPEERQRMVGYGTYDRVIDALDGAVAGREFIAGDRFSAADVYVGAHLDFGMMFKTIESRPAFIDYVSRLQARPAYQRSRPDAPAGTPAR